MSPNCCTCCNCRKIRNKETLRERQIRAAIAYEKLQFLVEKYKIKLSKPFFLNSDPDEMETEYKMHSDIKRKKDKVNFYKQIFLNLVYGAEFLNEQYNPYDIKLKDLSKKVADNMDNYTPILEELYEKYKNVELINLQPEEKLYWQFAIDCITNHLSQKLFSLSLPKINFLEKYKMPSNGTINPNKVSPPTTPYCNMIPPNPNRVPPTNPFGFSPNLNKPLVNPFNDYPNPNTVSPNPAVDELKNLIQKFPLSGSIEQINLDDFMKKNMEKVFPKQQSMFV